MGAINKKCLVFRKNDIYNETNLPGFSDIADEPYTSLGFSFVKMVHSSNTIKSDNGGYISINKLEFYGSKNLPIKENDIICIVEIDNPTENIDNYSKKYKALEDHRNGRKYNIYSVEEVN